jgi:hypothetical protein
MKTNGKKWDANFEGEVLHITGIAQFPNQFSTAGLERLKNSSADCISYRLTFYRDKEPYCDMNGIGPVHHYERHVSSEIQKIRIHTEEGTSEIPIRK